VKLRENLLKTWESPSQFVKRYFPETQKRALEELESKMQFSRYPVFILFGPHGTGKTFLVRYLLEKNGALSEGYININRILNSKPTEDWQNAILTEIKKRTNTSIIALDHCEFIFQNISSAFVLWLRKLAHSDITDKPICPRIICVLASSSFRFDDDRKVHLSLPTEDEIWKIISNCWMFIPTGKPKDLHQAVILLGNRNE